MDSRFIPEDLSVLIATYNRPEGLLNVLRTIPREIEVIVADDGTLPELKLPDGIKFYTHEHDGNRVSTCRNEGAKLATRPKILFLDDDVTPHGLCFAAHSLALEMFDVSLGLLPQKKWHLYTDDRLMFYINEEQILWNWCWTGNLAIRASAFWDVGGFDEDTFNGSEEEPAMGYEDVDLGRRLWLKKYRMTLNRLAMANHPAPHTAENPSEAILRNQERYKQKWGEV